MSKCYEKAMSKEAGMKRIKGKTTMRFMSISFIISLLWSQAVWALPQDGTVVAGSSTISAQQHNNADKPDNRTSQS